MAVRVVTRPEAQFTRERFLPLPPFLCATRNEAETQHRVTKLHGSGRLAAVSWDVKLCLLARRHRRFERTASHFPPKVGHKAQHLCLVL
jgi:hypothetical protein